MKTPDSLAKLAYKYLNYMVFIRSSSVQTIRSYRLDIIQALGLNSSEFPAVTDFFQTMPVPNPPSHAPTRLDDKVVLELFRSAITRWSPLSPASRNRKVATLKSFLGWLHDEGLIERELAAQIHAPRVPIRLPHHLSVDEALALLSSLQTELTSVAKSGRQTFQAERNLVLVLLLYGGGLRVSEACNLRWADLTSDGHVLRIKGKGEKERLVALPPLAAHALRNFKKARPTDSGTMVNGEFVFGDPPISTRIAYEIVRSAGVRAGLLKPLHPHALRHSFATHLLASGANLRTLQELLGHTTLQATQRYTHLGIDQLARTMEAYHPLGVSADGGDVRGDN